MCLLLIPYTLYAQNALNGCPQSGDDGVIQLDKKIQKILQNPDRLEELVLKIKADNSVLLKPIVENLRKVLIANDDKSKIKDIIESETWMTLRDIVCQYLNDVEEYRSATTGTEYFVTITDGKTDDYIATAEGNDVFTFDISKKNKLILASRYQLKGKVQDLGYSVDWYINGTKETEGELYEIDLSVPKNYKIAIKKDGVLIANNYEAETTTENLVYFEVNVVNEAIVTFSKPSDYKGEFGFDYYYIPQMKQEYEKLSDVSTLEYLVPWINIESGRPPIKILASLKGDIPDKVKFSSSDPAAFSIVGLSEFDKKTLQRKSEVELIILANTSIDKAELFVHDDNGKVIGKAFVSIRSRDDFISKKLILIPVITSDADVEALSDAFMNKVMTNLSNVVNYQIYNQAFVQWEFVLGDKESRQALDIRNQFDNKYSMTTLSGHNAIFDQLKNVYEKKLQPAIDYVMFVTNKVAFTAAGVAELGGRYSLLFANSFNSGDENIIAHELGHNLNLQHPFDAYPFTPVTSTKDNVMEHNDPAQLLRFFKFQWTALQNYKE